jgi:hypothetical protein
MLLGTFLLVWVSVGYLLLLVNHRRGRQPSHLHGAVRGWDVSVSRQCTAPCTPYTPVAQVKLRLTGSRQEDAKALRYVKGPNCDQRMAEATG